MKLGFEIRQFGGRACAILSAVATIAMLASGPSSAQSGKPTWLTDFTGRWEVVSENWWFTHIDFKLALKDKEEVIYVGAPTFQEGTDADLQKETWTLRVPKNEGSEIFMCTNKSTDPKACSLGAYCKGPLPLTGDEIVIPCQVIFSPRELKLRRVAN